MSINNKRSYDDDNIDNSDNKRSKINTVVNVAASIDTDLINIYYDILEAIVKEPNENLINMENYAHHLEAISYLYNYKSVLFKFLIHSRIVFLKKIACDGIAINENEDDGISFDEKFNQLYSEDNFIRCMYNSI